MNNFSHQKKQDEHQKIFIKKCTEIFTQPCGDQNFTPVGLEKKVSEMSLNYFLEHFKYFLKCPFFRLIFQIFGTRAAQVSYTLCKSFLGMLV